MAKDYAKFVPAKSRKPKRKLRLAGLLIAVFFFIFVCLGAAYFFLIMKKNSDLANRQVAVHDFISQVVRSVLHKNESLIRSSAQKFARAAENSPPPVHFDFYSALPKMQLTVTEAQDPPNIKNKTPVTRYEVGVKSSLTTLEDTKTSSKPKIVQAATTKAPSPEPAKVIRPEELSELIAAEKNSASEYVLQLGVFETEQAANKLQEALISVGFNPVIVKANSGNHNLYHVQQGPYANLQMAKQTKSKLQKRGITSFIRKIG